MADLSGLSEQQRYELYWNERKLLIEAERDGSKTFDKAMLTFTSGAFAISITFLKDIIPFPHQNTLWLLGWSWLLFALSLIAILFSFLASQNACLAQIDIAFDALEWQRGPDFFPVRDLCRKHGIKAPIFLALNYYFRVPDDLAQLGFVGHLNVPFELGEMEMKFRGILPSDKAELVFQEIV